MSNYDYLDLGTIWKSKRKGTLVSVIGLANFDLPEKYHKTNPPQVVFTDGTFIFSSDVKRFLSLRTFVRLDENLKNSLLELFSAPITEEEEDPSLYLDDDEDDLILSSDEDDAEDSVSVQQPYAQATVESKSQSTKLEAAVQKNLCTLTIESAQPEVQFDEVSSQFSGYDQLRDVNGTYYHKLIFRERAAIEYLLTNIDAVSKMTVNIDGIDVNVDVNCITTVYPSAINTVSSNNQPYTMYSYNIIVAEEAEDEYDQTEDTHSEEEPEKPTASTHVETVAPIAVESTVLAEDDIKHELVENIPQEEVHTNALTDTINANNDSSSMEQVSINAYQNDDTASEYSIADVEVAAEEDDDDFSNVEELPEEPKEEELTNAEEISEQELLASSIVMPSEEVDDLLSSDPVSESLANKLEVIASDTTEDASSLIEESLKDTVEEQQQDELDLTDETLSEEVAQSAEVEEKKEE